MSRVLNATLSAALDCRNNGYVPLRLSGKAPIDFGWSLSEPRVNDLFRYFYSDPRRYNLGICMGRPLTRGGLYPVAFDLDARSGGFDSWPAFLDGVELPPTAKAETGGCGKHWIMLSPVRFGCATSVFDLPGIDLVGAGGQVVIEPSVHPYTGKQYCWTIPPWHGLGVMPPRLVERLSNWFAGARRRPNHVEDAAPLGSATRSGDVAALTRRYIEECPIRGHGTRADAFKRLIPSLVGLGYDDATISTVAFGWWAHGYSRGLCRTSPRHATKEAGLYATRLRRSVRFRRATETELGHFARCEAIELTDEQRRLMSRARGWFTPQDAGPTRGGEEYNTSTKPIRGRLSDRLCEKEEEFFFVEAIVVHACHRWMIDPASTLTMTGKQIARIISDRHGVKMQNGSIDALVAKYIDRPNLGKPATVAPLLRRTVEGHNAFKGYPATPSEYDVVGLARFLELRPSEPVTEAIRPVATPPNLSGVVIAPLTATVEPEPSPRGLLPMRDELPADPSGQQGIDREMIRELFRNRLASAGIVGQLAPQELSLELPSGIVIRKRDHLGEIVLAPDPKDGEMVELATFNSVPKLAQWLRVLGKLPADLEV